jgi:thiosulfate dehydrogenase [quinone] large subunit
MNSQSTVAPAPAEFTAWTRNHFLEHPGRMAGISLVLLLRYLYGFFFFGAGINKITGGWLSTDKLHQVFTARLAELEPGSLGAAFLENFGLPMYVPIAWVVTIVEFAVAVSLWLGLATRTGGLLAIWLMAMFAIGGYYDASLIPLWAIAALFVVFPTGHWLGLDRRLHRRYPYSVWFR